MRKQITDSGIQRFVDTGVIDWITSDMDYHTHVSSVVGGIPDPVEFLNVVDTSLAKCLDYDRPMGFCLSGGLDSTTLVKLGERYGHIYTFSTVFPGMECDESKYVMAALDDGITSHVCVPSAPTREDIQNLITLNEGPIAGLSVYVQYRLMEFAAQYGTKVLIDGQGPDEMLGGYIAYQAVYVRTLWRKGYRLLALWEMLGSVYHHFGFWRKAFKLRRQNATKVYDGMLNKPLNEVMYDDLLFDSVPVEMDTIKRSSAVFGLDVRSPYLDPKVVQYMASLPYNEKIRGGISKWILRVAGRRIVPDIIRNRQDKLGFPAPEAYWMKVNLKPLVLEIIYSESFSQRKFWNTTEIRKMYQQFLKGTIEYDRKLWRVVCTEMWLRGVAK
jgi:asparagine synthase (glutamine-hydrolysing)